MKRILIILLGLFSVAYGQSSPTSSKTRFVNGLYAGTKLDSYFNTADSNAIYWRSDSALMAKYRGTPKPIGGSTAQIERNGPAFTQYNNKNQPGTGLARGTVGMLGHPEMNLSFNMDYQLTGIGTGAIHKFFDTTINASWLALLRNGWALQHAPYQGNNNGNVWAAGGSRYLFYQDTLGQIGVNTNISTPRGDSAMLYLNRRTGFRSVVGNGDLVLEGGRIKGAKAPVYINPYNDGHLIIGFQFNNPFGPKVQVSGGVLADSIIRRGSNADSILLGNGTVRAVSDFALSGTLTTNTIPKATGVKTIGNSNITDNGTLVTVGSNTRFNGAISQNIAVANNIGLYLGRPISGLNQSYGTASIGQVQSDVTLNAWYNRTIASTQAASFTLTNLHHFNASQGTFGAGSTVTNQFGFFAEPNLTGAVNNFAFYSNIASGAGRWAFYNNGTANSLFNGRTLFGPTTTTDDGATRMQVNGGITATLGIRAQRITATSLVVNKDSIPITTSNLQALFVDTSGVAGTNRVNRRSLANVLTASLAFDTTTRTLTIPTLAGGSSSVVIPRGAASGTSGITALSSSKIGNLVTVSGDNGSSTTFSIRDADSTATLSDLTAGSGLSGTAYNGSTPRTFEVDTTVISTKNNVDAGLVTKLNLSGGELTGSLSGTTLSMRGETLLGGAASNGVDKLRVNGTSSFSLGAKFGAAVEVVNNSEFASFRLKNINDSLRWGIGNTDIESGSNTGSNFSIFRYTDAGVFIDRPFVINRANGSANFINSVTAQRGNFTSLVLNKDSVPITTTNTQVLTIDTASGMVQRNTITSGIYLPTAANVSNTSAITIDTAQFMRVGNVVTVSGRIAFTNTLNSPSQISITLPVATIVSNVRDVAGVGNENIAMKSAIIRGRTGTNDALLEVDGLNSSTYTIYYTYTYRIL